MSSETRGYRRILKINWTQRQEDECVLRRATEGKRFLGKKTSSVDWTRIETC